MLQKHMLEEEYNEKVLNLKSKCRWLSQELTRLSNRLEKNPKDVVVSSGVVQGMGSDIDRLCAEINVLKYSIELFESLEQNK